MTPERQHAIIMACAVWLDDYRAARPPGASSPTLYGLAVACAWLLLPAEQGCAFERDLGGRLQSLQDGGYLDLARPDSPLVTPVGRALDFPDPDVAVTYGALKLLAARLPLADPHRLSCYARLIEAALMGADPAGLAGAASGSEPLARARARILAELKTAAADLAVLA